VPNPKTLAYQRIAGVFYFIHISIRPSLAFIPPDLKNLVIFIFPDSFYFTAMNLSVKFDISFTCKTILQEQLDAIGAPYEIIGINEIIFKQPLSEEQLSILKSSFDKYGIGIIPNQKLALVQKMKDLITEMVWKDDKLPNITTSAYLSEKLHHSYGYLSNLFSEITYTSVENFVILQKIERAKQMMISNHYTLTEIAFHLNYSSVAHLSNQFKKITGLTPSSFQRIIKVRRAQQNSI